MESAGFVSGVVFLNNLQQPLEAAGGSALTEQQGCHQINSNKRLQSKCVVMHCLTQSKPQTRRLTLWHSA